MPLIIPDGRQFDIVGSLNEKADKDLESAR